MCEEVRTGNRRLSGGSKCVKKLGLEIEGCLVALSV